MEPPATLTLRPARLADLAAVDLLLQRSYPRLLKADYPPSTLVCAVPLLVRANPRLLASGRYFLALRGGRLLGAGGYSPGAGGLAHIRHVATDPDALRQGIGAAVLRHVFAAAAGEGLRRFACLATRTAVPFYQSLGFRALGPVTVPLAPGIGFEAVQMIRGE
jgi:GNAT superfamily N-acetyltransferase